MVRGLRTKRLWTQAELAERLALSQARLSEIERGLGSFSAEHLLELLRLFNVDASYFAPTPHEHESQLQNALARLGAPRLDESEHVLPSERVAAVNEVFLEVLVDAKSPRLLMTGLAPVLVARIDQVQPDVVASRIASLGLSHRLGWLVDNTVAALTKLEADPAPIHRTRSLRRAQAVLQNCSSARGRGRERRSEATCSTRRFEARRRSTLCFTLPADPTSTQPS